MIRIIGILLSFFSLNAFSMPTPVIHEINHESWTQMPNSLIKYVVVAGNPKEKNLFVLRIKIPPHTQMGLHSHRNGEYDTVLIGSCDLAWYQGRTVKHELVQAGSFVSIPPGILHYGWTNSQEVVIQISAIGPWSALHSRYLG